MRLEYIREFVCLSDTGTYRETANRMYVSQSTLSKHVRAMEDELGVRLTERSGRAVSLTRDGKIFLQFARQMIALEDQCTETLRAAEQGTDSGEGAELDA